VANFLVENVDLLLVAGLRLSLRKSLFLIQAYPSRNILQIFIS